MSPSYRIVFYVSGHGFGHTSRTIAVIHAVLHARPDAHVVVKTSAPFRLFRETLGERCEFVELQCDAGIVQIDSLRVDTLDTIRQAVEFQNRLPALVDMESAYLRKTGARVAVCDIPPLGVAAAYAAGIPSVAVSNFTWDWIYEGYDSDATAALARDIRELYRHVTTALRLPMTGGFAGLEPVTRDVPFIARRSSRTQDEVRKKLGLPRRADGKPLVLLAFGSYGVERLNTAALAALEKYTIAATDGRLRDNAATSTSGLLYISEQDISANGLSYQDLVRGADVVVTKPGYGIISEAIANDAALLYTSRGQFIEYDVLVKEMPRYLRARFIEQEDLLKGNWSDALEKLLNQPAPPETPALNGAEVVAEEILKLVTKTE